MNDAAEEQNATTAMAIGKRPAFDGSPAISERGLVFGSAVDLAGAALVEVEDGVQSPIPALVEASDAQRVEEAVLAVCADEDLFLEWRWPPDPASATPALAPRPTTKTSAARRTASASRGPGGS
jgi:hypothetical protein